MCMPVRQSKLQSENRNVVIGPGGLLSGAYKPEVKPDELVIRHLDEERISEWKNQSKSIFCFGTGTNTPFNAAPTAKPFSPRSEQIIGRLASLSKALYLRGTADILRLQGFCNSEDMVKFKFQPCPSLFCDKLFGIKPHKEDKIAINLPLSKVITEVNWRTHPLRKFVEYAHSVGLKVSFLDNHTMDLNKYVMEVFDETTHTNEFVDFIKSDAATDHALVQAMYQKQWEECPSLPARFNGYRFAFGSRLHSFLPFMAFNTPSVFLSSNPIRMQMPMDYFNHPAFGAKVVYKSNLMNEVVDGMIDRLNYFIKHENILIDIIQESKYRLWALTKKNQHEMLSLMP